MNGSWKHHAKWKQQDTTDYTVWFHLYKKMHIYSNKKQNWLLSAGSENRD